MDIMIVYLILIWVSSGEYSNPESSYSYFQANSLISSVKVSDSSITILSAQPEPLVKSLDLSFNTLFAFVLQCSNSYTPVSLQVSDLIYVLVNVFYLNSQIPGLLGSENPSLNKIHPLLIILTYQGELVRTQWIGNCMELDSWGLDLYVDNRVFVVEKNLCNGQQANIFGIHGESTEKVELLESSAVKVKGKEGNVVVGVSTQSGMDFYNADGMGKFYSTTGNVSDFAVGNELVVVKETKVEIVKFDGNLVNSISIPIAKLRYVESKEKILISADIFTNILDFSLLTSKGTILFMYSPALELQAFRGFSSISNTTALSTSSVNTLFVSSNLLSFSENSFSQRSIPYCLNSTYNILGQATCNLCPHGFYLIANHCLSDIRCPAGTIQDFFSQTCMNCYAGCASCTNSSQSGCTICKNGYNLFDNQCLINCPIGMFPLNNQCISCPDKCQSCNSISCFSCKSAFLFSGTCLDSCPLGTYLSFETCINCQDHCSNCNNTFCITCDTGYYLSNGTCGKCIENCESCENGLCGKCFENFTLADGKCYLCENCQKCDKGNCTQCNIGFYSVDGNCNKCDSGCEDCKSITDCKKCTSGWELRNHTCIKCKGFMANNSCSNCSSGCEKCDENSCFQCEEGWGFHSGVCEPCESSCKTCENQTCSECYSGVLWENTCIESCPLSFELQNNTCVQCPEHCEQCIQGLCTFCMSDFNLNIEYQLANGKCATSQCAPGYFLSNSTCISHTNFYFSYFEAILSISLKF